ncbi:hypothetical protein [Microseira wollei]|nr:hypothetical protein [Microseira wollei]
MMPCLCWKDNEGLITVKSGQRDISDEERKALRAKIQRFRLDEPVKVWCKILRATASEDVANKRVKLESQVYEAIDSVPIPEVDGEILDWQKDWSVEWLVLPQPYQNPPVSDPCLQLYASSEDFAKNHTNVIKRMRFTKIELDQPITQEGGETKALDRVLIEGLSEDAIAAKVKMRSRLEDPQQLSESCNLGEEVEVPVPIRGAGLRPAQQAIAKIIGISTWTPSNARR